MNAAAVLSDARRSLAGARVRTGLTMLGVAIGVAAVVALVSLGQGAIQQSADDIAAMGLNLIMVTPGSKLLAGARVSGGITTLVPEDAAAILAECPEVVLVAPGVRTGARVICGNQNAQTSLRGTSPDWPVIRNWSLARGAFFDADAVRRQATVCVIGATVADQLFGGSDPVGASVRVNRVPFRVVGVFVRRGQDAGGHDEDDLMVAPWTTVMRRVMGVTYLGSIQAAARDAESIGAATRAITVVLRRRHRLLPGEDDDFTVRTPEDIAAAHAQTALVLTTLVVVVALVALVVGGVGVMNIMLVTVLERTREIGLRMAVGARARDLVAQFLVEAVLLTTLGGVLGVAGGIGASRLFPRLLGWPTVVTAAPVAIAFSFSVVVGVLFGFYPAWRASRLDPIDALRGR